MFGDVQPFALSCFNQSTLKRQTAGPEDLYLYLFSLNFQLTFFRENMPHSSPYEFNSPSSAIFCLKQATQLFTTFTEAGVTCSNFPQNHDCSSGFSQRQTPNCREGTSSTTPAGELSPMLPWDRLPRTSWHPAPLLASNSHMLLRKWYHLLSTLNTKSDAEGLQWQPRRSSAVHLCQPSPPALL